MAGKSTSQTTGQTPSRTTGRNTVFVYANLPGGQSFLLPDGNTVTIRGNNMDYDLRNPQPLPVGAFGVTEVPADDWNEVVRLYGKMAVLNSGVVFAAPDREAGDAQASERSGLRHGVEPVDTRKTLTQPKV